MKLATLACLALCLIGPCALAAPSEPAKAPDGVKTPDTAKIPEPAKAPAGMKAPDVGKPPAPASAEPATAPTQTTARPAATARAERRRRSYAACNRASHQRSLHGGKRRRFLIRCRLGYERTRAQQIPAPLPSAPPTAGAPGQPSRRP